jgi:hypothetical protein
VKNASVVVRALVFGAVVVVAVAVIGSLIAALTTGPRGVVSVLVAAGLTALFLGVTSASIILAERVTRDRPSVGIYFGIILGMWALKFVVFLVILIVMRGAEWLDPFAFFVAVIIAVIGSLVADVIALAGARVSPIAVSRPE